MTTPTDIIAATIFDNRTMARWDMSSRRFAELIVFALEIRGFKIVPVEEPDQTA